MMQKLLAFLSFLSVVLLGLFLKEKSSNEDNELKLANSELKNQDAVLNSKVVDNTAAITTEEQALKSVPTPVVDNLSQSQVVDYWNNKK